MKETEAADTVYNQGMQQIVRVLLADDHAIVRAGLRNALEELPHINVINEVGDGAALMVALEQNEPDCLLIDVTMPYFEPIKMTRQIRDLYPTLKILVVSAFDDDVYVQGLFGAGVNGYHLKDQSLADLRLAVQRVMAGERWVSHRLFDKLLNPAQPPREVPPLTGRQLDILRLLLDGRDNLTIARELGISVKTVENHLTRLYRQLNVQSRLEAVNFVRQQPTILNPGGTAERKPAAAIRRPLLKPNTKQRIMVVDDNARYRRQLKRTIGKLAATAIEEAENTAAAVQVAKKYQPTLIFVDVVLGNEDGIDCVRQLKAQHPKSRFILISAYPDREFHRRGIEAGAIALLDKKDLDSMALQQIIADSG